MFRVAGEGQAARGGYGYGRGSAPYYYPQPYAGGIFYPPTPAFDETTLKDKLKSQMYAAHAVLTTE